MISDQLAHAIEVGFGGVGREIVGILDQPANPAVPNTFRGTLSLENSAVIKFSGVSQKLQVTDDQILALRSAARALSPGRRYLDFKAFYLQSVDAAGIGRVNNRGVRFAAEANLSGRLYGGGGTFTLDRDSFSVFDAVPQTVFPVVFYQRDVLATSRTHAAPTATAIDTAAMGPIALPIGAFTIVAVGNTMSTDASNAIQTNFMYLVTELNRIIADQLATKKLLNQIIDDLQAYGLFQ